MTSALGTIVSLADAIELCVPVANRRREVRRKPSDVRWLRGARLKYGPQVVVIDISASGILVKNDEELRANAPVVFEFSGMTGAVLVLARVLRSRRVVSGELVWYEIACRFKRPVAFPGLVADVRRRENAKARLVHLNGSASAKASAVAR
jgi:PilZ domain-containing protein